MSMKKVMAILLVAVMTWSINNTVFAEEIQPQSTETTTAAVPAEPAATPEEKQEAPAATPEVSEEPQTQPEATPVPTVEPETATDDANAETEATEEELTEEEMMNEGNEEIVPDLSNVKVTIHCLNDGEVQIGDSVTLAVSVEGVDGLSYSIQWQYFDGSEWKDKNGASDTTITYTLTKDNAEYAWRVILTID